MNNMSCQEIAKIPSAKLKMAKHYSCKCSQYGAIARGATCDFCGEEIELRPKKNIRDHIEILDLMEKSCFKVWKKTGNPLVLSLSNRYKESRTCAELVFEGRANEKTKRKAFDEWQN